MAACQSQADEEPVRNQGPAPGNSFVSVSPSTNKQERSCSVYVPAYSHIYLTKNQTASLGITLSIRNVDSRSKIHVTRVEYYDTNGALTDVLAGELFALEAMSTVSYVIDQHDMRGGVGANFIVRWTGAKQTHPPIMEAVMVGSVGTKGYSFSSRGETISCSENE
ncbi:DUF3124 domain-containing protein [Methylomonas sp. MgM2]